MYQQGVYWADIAFPILSFALTIVGPAVVALWVIARVVKDMRQPAGDGATAPGAKGGKKR
ncbi:MAG: hypothetical protein HY904_15805 [Deltaproteobacteria bacterium]|nr:hypothetical protein [Deltaproteobacteria bacterium]